MGGTTRSSEPTAGVYASYVLRVWRHRADGLPVRVDIEHVQSGQRITADADDLADFVARIAAPFPVGRHPPSDAS